MAALLVSRFPQKAPELFAYQASILRTERNFVDCRWVACDRCYRREALAQKNLDWSVPNARLYNEAFTGHARIIPRFSFYLQEDHLAHVCPHNPAQSNLGQQTGQSLECCRRFNSGKCKQSAFSCRYSHFCVDCGGPHPRPQLHQGESTGWGSAALPSPADPPAKSPARTVTDGPSLLGKRAAPPPCQLLF